MKEMWAMMPTDRPSFEELDAWFTSSGQSRVYDNQVASSEAAAYDNAGTTCEDYLEVGECKKANDKLLKCDQKPPMNQYVHLGTFMARAGILTPVAENSNKEKPHEYVDLGIFSVSGSTTPDLV